MEPDNCQVPSCCDDRRDRGAISLWQIHHHEGEGIGREEASPPPAFVTLIAVAVASLAGAILGGLSGMRFHSKVDQVGLDS